MIYPSSGPFIEAFFPRFVAHPDPHSSGNEDVEENRKKIIWYNYHGRRSKNMFQPGCLDNNWIELNVPGWKCQVQNCQRIATHAMNRGYATHCNDHKQNSMQVIRFEECKNCNRIPTHGLVIMPFPSQFCKDHSIEIEGAVRSLPSIGIWISLVKADKTPWDDGVLEVKRWNDSYFVRIEKSTQRGGKQHDKILLQVQSDATKAVSYSRPIEVWTRNDNLFPSPRTGSLLRSTPGSQKRRLAGTPESEGTYRSVTPTYLVQEENARLKDENKRLKQKAAESKRLQQKVDELEAEVKHLQQKEPQREEEPFPLDEESSGDYFDTLLQTLFGQSFGDKTLLDLS